MAGYFSSVIQRGVQVVKPVRRSLVRALEVLPGAVTSRDAEGDTADVGLARVNPSPAPESASSLEAGVRDRGAEPRPWPAPEALPVANAMSASERRKSTDVPRSGGKPKPDPADPAVSSEASSHSPESVSVVRHPETPIADDDPNEVPSLRRRRIAITGFVTDEPITETRLAAHPSDKRAMPIPRIEFGTGPLNKMQGAPERRESTDVPRSGGKPKPEPADSPVSSEAAPHAPKPVSVVRHPETPIADDDPTDVPSLRRRRIAITGFVTDEPITETRLAAHSPDKRAMPIPRIEFGTGPLNSAVVVPAQTTPTPNNAAPSTVAIQPHAQTADPPRREAFPRRAPPDRSQEQPSLIIKRLEVQIVNEQSPARRRVERQVPQKRPETEQERLARRYIRSVL
jgi:hypothetical protein